MKMKYKVLLRALLAVPVLIGLASFIVLLALVDQQAARENILRFYSTAIKCQYSIKGGTSNFCEWCPNGVSRMRLLLLEKVEGASALDRAKHLPLEFSAEKILLIDSKGLQAITSPSTKQETIQNLMVEYSFDQETAEAIANGVVKAANAFDQGDLPKACKD